MARTAIPLYITNALITAAHGNTYWRDNEAAHWPFTTAGDSVYATAANTLARLGIGTAGQVKKVNAGATAPEWGNGGMTLIEEKLLGAPAASFDFTAIPATYRNLKLIINARGTYAGTYIIFYLTLNGDNGNNYDYQMIQTIPANDPPYDYSINETFGGPKIIAGMFSASTAGANLAGSTEILLFDYKGTTFNKVLLAQSLYKTGTAAGNTKIIQIAGFWRNSAVIDRITIAPSANNYDTGSVASLYGLT